MQKSTDHWEITITNGVKVCVEPDIQKMTPYVLLEQEDWFEDEMDFVRAYVTPEMNAFDIGANHGVYGLSMARKLKSGHVWAFEPTVAPGGMLARSILANGFSDRMTWVHAGLSSHDGMAKIHISPNSELNSLHSTGGETEDIFLFALDKFIERNAVTGEIGFVKLDAEGEEIKILEGGHEFFTGQSPLVMFELKHGNEVNHGLIEAVEALGYGIYRLVPGLNALVAYHDNFRDGFLLNLFAAKPDRVEQLKARGLLIAESDPLDAISPQPGAWISYLQDHAFAVPFLQDWKGMEETLDSGLDFALSASAMADDPSVPLDRRFALMTKALVALNMQADAGKGDLAVWLVRLNLAHRLGERGLAVGIAQKLAGLQPDMFADLKLPFILPSPEFYQRSIGANKAGVLQIVKEFAEYRKAFSSYFTPPNIRELSQFVTHPGHDLEIQRRLVLSARRQGAALALPAQHLLLQPQRSANASAWLAIAPPRVAA